MDTQEQNTNQQFTPEDPAQPAIPSTAPEIAEIAAGLNEPNIELLNRVAAALGIGEMQAVYQRTLEVEAAGGMLTVRGNRRRTPGGVFFFLVRQRRTAELCGAARTHLLALASSGRTLLFRDRAQF